MGVYVILKSYKLFLLIMQASYGPGIYLLKSLKFVETSYIYLPKFKSCMLALSAICVGQLAMGM